MTREELHQLWERKDSWKWGVIYNQPEDPRWIVRRRYFYGYTVNFARRTALLVVLGAVAVVMIPVWLAILAGATVQMTFIAVLLTVALVLYVCHWEWSRDRD